MRISRKQAKELGIDLPVKASKLPQNAFGTAEAGIGPSVNLAAVLGGIAERQKASGVMLEIPKWTPPTTNQWYGKHWRTRHALKKATTAIIALHASQQFIRKASCKRKVTLSVWGWPTGRLPDVDNFAKIFLDALRDCRLILDDDAKGLESFTVKIERSLDRRTVIVLEDC